MLLDRTVSLAARPRCMGCRVSGSWACPDCLGQMSPASEGVVAGTDRAFIPWSYEGVARDLILALKVRGKRPAAGPLADTIADLVQRRGSDASAITWVPGRAEDIRRRGFDHAHAIASALGVRLGLPVVSVLHRTGDRPDQTTLDRDARRCNLEGAFVAGQGPRSIILVDDLVTTGATIWACAGTLRDRGTTHVEVAAACRA